jgi:hypothetical protein
MIAHLGEKYPVAENSLEGRVFLQTWEQKRRKDFISLCLARHSKHLLDFDNAGSVETRIGEVLRRKVKNISSNTT